MIFTEEQFEYLTKYNIFVMNDLPFVESEEDMLKVFNLLPNKIQYKALQWGIDDIEVKDLIFEYMIKNQFNMTVDEYYKSKIVKDYCIFNKTIKIDYDKLEGGKND